jgi:tetratricopeptide (TPR) repeat protein
VSSPRARRWIAVVLLAAALAAQVLRARRRVEATHLVVLVEQRTLLLAGQDSPDPRELRRNLMLLDRAGALHPSMVAIAIVRGSQFLLLGRYDEAIAAYQEALDLEPRAETHFNLGRAFLLAGDREAARRHLDLAASAAPRLTKDVRLVLGERTTR